MKKAILALTMILSFSMLLHAQTIDTFPFKEGFEDSIEPLSNNYPNGWTSESNGTGSALNLGWTVTNIPPGQAHEGDWYILAVGSTTFSLDEWLFSPPMQFQMGNTYRISFHYKTSTSGGDPVRLFVGDTPNSASMTGNPIWQDLIIDNTVYEKGELSYTATSNQLVYFGFNITSSGGRLSQTVFDSITFELEDTLSASINDFNSPNIEITPNPITTSFKVTFTNNEDMSLIIYNTLGKKVLKEKYVANNQVIDTSHLSKGIYLVKIFNDNTSVSKKIVKE